MTPRTRRHPTPHRPCHREWTQPQFNLLAQNRPILTNDSSVIAKLLLFTLAMVVLPLGSFFVTRDYIFRGTHAHATSYQNSLPGLGTNEVVDEIGNSTYAGAFAAVMANVVLIGYVIVAFQDDKAEREELAEKERKKTR